MDMEDINELQGMFADIDDIEDIIDRRRRKQKTYLEHVNPFEKYDDIEFKKIYRFKKDTMRTLIDSVRPILENGQAGGRKGRPVTVEIQVLSTIRYLAKGNYQSESAHLHGFSQATMSRIAYRVTRAIASLINLHIFFPRNERALLSMKEQFHNVSNMPNIVGAIDCTHIKIKNPGHYPLLYINRKGFFSLNVQVVCDAQARITDIVARWRGSAHDSRIWMNCNLKTRFELGQINGILIGDNGYPSSEFMLIPVLNPTTPAEQRYNEAHIRTRNVVERLFGQWKNKFRCFFNGMQMSLETAKASIIALAVLHNIAVNERLNNINEDDSSDSDLDESDDDDDANDPVNNQRQDNDRRNLFRQNYINTYFN